MARKKKKYNPFKMWGSYVGAIGYPLLLVIMVNSGLLNSPLKILYYPSMLIALPLGILFLGDIGFGGLGMVYIIYLIVSVFVGFLIGWGIHSIIRRLRK